MPNDSTYSTALHCASATGRRCLVAATAPGVDVYVIVHILVGGFMMLVAPATSIDFSDCCVSGRALSSAILRRVVGANAGGKLVLFLKDIAFLKRCFDCLNSFRYVCYVDCRSFLFF